MDPGFSHNGAPQIMAVVRVLRRLRANPILGYAAAILVIGAATAVQWLLRTQLAGAPFLTIYPGIIITTAIGGLGPGLLAAALSGASQFGLFIPGHHWVAVGTYAVDATLCVLLSVVVNRTVDVLWTNAELEKQANQHQFVIARELHHRIQNLFAVIQGIIRFSIPATGAIEAGELRERLVERLQSMAVANRAITDSIGEGVPLFELVKTEIRGVQPRVELSGASDVVLSARMTQNLSLIIHELVTNALKHGALSVPEGHVSVRVDWEPPVLTFVWQERRAPARTQAGSAGFGSRLLSRFAESFCQAVDAAYGPDGLRYALKIRSDDITSLSAERQIRAAE